MGYKSRNSFVRQRLTPAIEEGFITLAYPDKPNVPNQRYGLTLKGKALYYKHSNDVLNGPQNDSEGQNDPLNDPQNDFKGQNDVLNGPQNDVQKEEADPQKRAILEAIKLDGCISRARLAAIVGCSASTIKRRLKEMNIAWLGHPRNGHWVFVREIE